MKLKTVLFVTLLMLAKLSNAQNIRLLRFDEDYSALKDSARTFYNRLKYLPLSESGKTYVSFGGELRAELDQALNEDWGARNIGRNIFLLQRYQLHADLHLSDRIRIFGQLRSGLENGRKTGPRPIDEDQLNVQNLFADLIPYKGTDSRVTIRLASSDFTPRKGDWTSVTGIIEGDFTKPMPIGGGKSIPPTGKHFKFQAVTVAHWKNGKMDEEYLFWDNLDFMKRVGLAK